MTETEAYQLSMQGFYAKRKGQYEEAFQLYHRAIKLQPNDGDICFAFAQLHFIMGKYRNAVDLYLRCYPKLLETSTSTNPLDQYIKNKMAVYDLDPSFLRHLGWANMADCAKQNEISGKTQGEFNIAAFVYRYSIDPYFETQHKNEFLKYQNKYIEVYRSFDDESVKNAVGLLNYLIRLR